MSTFSNPLTEYSPQLETGEFTGAGEFEDRSRQGMFAPEEEMDLAARLLDAGDEQQLDHFLGDLIRKAAGVVGKVIASPAGKAIGGALKGVLKRALPVAGGALGGMFGGPLGAKVGSALASQAGQVFGFEMEGLSPEDREFEAARQFVRFAGAAVGEALSRPSNGDPARAAYESAMDAARVYAPGLMNTRPAQDGRRAGPRGNSGRPYQEATFMHDIDRTQVGYEYESENADYESGQPYEAESYGMDEAEAMDFAAELMEMESEEEFESLLGSLISRAVKAAGGYLSSPNGKALAGLLKGAARQVLPLVQQVAGDGTTGEYEGEEGGVLSESEMEALEWENAQAFVNLAQEAAVNATQAPPDADPAQVAKKAVADAAKIHAPTLLTGAPQPGPGPAGAGAGRPHGGCGCSRKNKGGRWVRRGNQIVIYGA